MVLIRKVNIINNEDMAEKIMKRWRKCKVGRVTASVAGTVAYCPNLIYTIRLNIFVDKKVF